MKISQVFVLLVVGCLAPMLYGCSDQETAKLIGPITTKLNAHIADMACLSTEVFPFSSKDRPDSRCQNCGKFVDAGLLTKEIHEDQYSSDTQQANAPAPDILFLLTDIGKETYTAGTSQSAYGKDASHFCFGHVRVNQITRIVGPVMNGDVRMLGIRYIAELEYPNAFVFDPRAKFLGIPLPEGGQITAGKPVLYAERNVTVLYKLDNPNRFVLDESIKIGN